MKTDTEASPIRFCRVCGCTETRACPGGCAWALEDVCTSCIGHTPASWAAFLDDPCEDGARPPALRLIAAMHAASDAVAQIGEHLIGLGSRPEFDHQDAARGLALSLSDLLGAVGHPTPVDLALVEAVSAYLHGEPEAAADVA